jgi:ABC-type transport system involved in cytochrome c biogenesis ATPase subunit
MRIAQISVNGLFGFFNHRIPMNMDERITIIHGPNGFGKTTILKLVNGLMTGRHWDLRSIPFTSLTIEFDDLRTLQVVKSIDRRSKKEGGQNLDIKLIVQGKEMESIRLKPFSREAFRFPLSSIDEIIPELVRQGPHSWQNMHTGEILNIEEVFERYEDALAATRGVTPPEADSTWLGTLRKEMSIDLIESQRLLRLGDRTRGPHGWQSYPAVVLFAARLAQQIQRTLAEYGALSQRLDRTFPMRLVKGASTSSGQSLPAEKLREKLAQLEKRRRTLREVGLLEKEDEQLEYPEALQTLTQQVLPVYVADTEEKLAVFDDLAARIETLKEVVNSRFMFKRLDITKEDGFRFTGLSGQPLKVTQLSSGEQHMIVLFSELLFSVPPNALVMIDEPEISLHVTWQHDFLSDIKRIADLSRFDLLIATHSPQIINQRWNLTVDLVPPAEGAA